MDEREEYQRNLEQLVAVRTDQLRHAFAASEELLQCLRRIEKMESLDDVKASARAVIEKHQRKP